MHYLLLIHADEQALSEAEGEEQEVPGLGAFCLFPDPEGRMMVLWRETHKSR